MYAENEAAANEASTSEPFCCFQSENVASVSITNIGNTIVDKQYVSRNDFNDDDDDEEEDDDVDVNVDNDDDDDDNNDDDHEHDEDSCNQLVIDSDRDDSCDIKDDSHDENSYFHNDVRSGNDCNDEYCDMKDGNDTDVSNVSENDSGDEVFQDCTTSHSKSNPVFTTASSPPPPTLLSPLTTKFVTTTTTTTTTKLLSVASTTCTSNSSTCSTATIASTATTNTNTSDAAASTITTTTTTTTNVIANPADTDANASASLNLPKSETDDVNNNVQCSHESSLAQNQVKSLTNFRLLDWIFVGSAVLARWKNGLYYLAIIEKVDIFSEHCLVRYEDLSIYWTHFKDLHKQVSVGTIMSDSDILCAICRDGASKKPNEIVICDICNQGYHQLCHKPEISDDILSPEIPWSCRKCIFALSTAEGGAAKPTTREGAAMSSMKLALPYDLKSLDWDKNHFTNRQNVYCYCGGPGEYYSKMLQCRKCFQWFHEACIQVLEHPLLYGDHYYKFTCAICSVDRKESLKRIIMKWSDMVALVLNNLSRSSTEGKRYFDVNANIIPFIQKNADRMKLNLNLNKLKESELVDRVVRILQKYKSKFKSMEEPRSQKTIWGLKLKPFGSIDNCDGALIFAPPFAISSSYQIGENFKRDLVASNDDSTSSLRVSYTNDKASNSSKSQVSPFPIVYGACRKGAKILPKSASTSDNASSSGDSGNSSNLNLFSSASLSKCSSIGSSSSCSSTSTGFSGTSSQKRRYNRQPARITKKLKTGQRHRSKPRPKRLEIFDAIDLELSSMTLDAFIPRPENFDGINNPFYDLDGISPRVKTPTKLSRKPSQTAINDYQIVKGSGHSSKLTLKRISTSSDESSRLLTLDESATLLREDEAKTSTEDEVANSKRTTIRDFTIIAKRLTKDGRIEYLVDRNIHTDSFLPE